MTASRLTIARVRLRKWLRARRKRRAKVRYWYTVVGRCVERIA